MWVPDFPATDRTRVHGRVIEGATLTAPLSGDSVVAYRLWGRYGGEAIDHAAAVPFALALPGGDRLSIEASPEAILVAFYEGDGELRHHSAWIHPWAIPLGRWVLRSGRLPSSLSTVLETLGRAEPGGSGVLYELTLPLGAGAIVEGESGDSTLRGYRDARPARALRDGDSGPVVLRARDAPPGT